MEYVEKLNNDKINKIKMIFPLRDFFRINQAKSQQFVNKWICYIFFVPARSILTLVGFL